MGWVGRLCILEAIYDYANTEDLRVVLTDSKAKSIEVTIADKNNNKAYEFIATSRRLGEDMGNDILINLSNYLKSLKQMTKDKCRKLTEQENIKLQQILKS